MGEDQQVPNSWWSTIRKQSKPSTANCDLNTYTLFLMSEPKYGGCRRLAEVMEDCSHDSVNRFLLRERYEPKDLFAELKPWITLVGGVLSADDTVIDKPYSDRRKAELIGYFWSGKHHKAVKGINLITLYYRDVQGRSVPVNYRIYTKSDGKTKNEYLREMIAEVLAWGVKPILLTADAWYAALENLKFLKNQEIGFLFGIERNRTVSSEAHIYQQVQQLEIPADGLMTHLKGFGWVRVFRTVFENQDARFYVLYQPDPSQLEQTTRLQFEDNHQIHWGIESYHRATKQVCGLQRFMLRDSDAIRTHLFCALRAFVQLERMRFEQVISNWYQVQRQLFKAVIRQFITKHHAQLIQPLPADLCFSVNA